MSTIKSNFGWLNKLKRKNSWNKFFSVRLLKSQSFFPFSLTKEIHFSFDVLNRILVKSFEFLKNCWLRINIFLKFFFHFPKIYWSYEIVCECRTNTTKLKILVKWELMRKMINLLSLKLIGTLFRKIRIKFAQSICFFSRTTLI